MYVAMRSIWIYSSIVYYCAYGIYTSQDIHMQDTHCPCYSYKGGHAIQAYGHERNIKCQVASPEIHLRKNSGSAI